MNVAIFHFIIISFLLLFLIDNKTVLADSTSNILVRSCSLADYIRVRGNECEQGLSQRSIYYTLSSPDVTCRGPARIDLGEKQDCSACELSDLAPFGTGSNNEIPPDSCGWDGEHNVNVYQKSQHAPSTANCGAAIAISGADVPCVCTADNIKSSLTECLNGTRKLVYYYDYDCDSSAFGATRLPQQQQLYGPCDIVCDHGEFAHPLCTKCPKNTFSFSGHQFVAPYHVLPSEFVEQCYISDNSNNDGLSACPPNSPAGWRPCDDGTCITSGNTVNLNSIDIQFIWHFDIVSLPASVSFEYRIESEEFFDWFGVETKTEQLMWDSGNHPDWKFFQHNFTNIPFSEMCSWSINGSVCVYPNNFAPFDPESFWKPELSDRVDPSAEPFNYRDIILLPVSMTQACVETSYTGHRGLPAAKTSSALKGDIVFVVDLLSTGGACSVQNISEHVKKVPEAKGLILVMVGSPDRSLGNGFSSTLFPRGLYIGSISIPQDSLSHPAYAPVLNFQSVLFSTTTNSLNEAHQHRLRWNRSPGHRIQLNFFYTKDGATSIGKDRVELKNIRVEGTVKATATCNFCPPGTSTNGKIGQGKCGPCSANFFSSQPGEDCKPCKNGTVSAIGSTSCVFSRSCTEDDYEAVLYSCHLNQTTGVFEQRISYRLPQVSGLSPSCSPVPGFSIPDKYEPCDQCHFGEVPLPFHSGCLKCRANETVTFDLTTASPPTRQKVGCEPCSAITTTNNNNNNKKHIQIPDTQISFTNFLLFNGTLPADIFSQSDCYKCLEPNGWDFNLLSRNDKYENEIFFAEGGLGMTVLSVGERLLPGGTSTLSMDFDQQMSGPISFDYYSRLPLSLGNPFSPSSHPEIDFAHAVDVIVYDMTDPENPQKILETSVGVTTSRLHQRVSIGYFEPCPKRISWTYKNVLPENNGGDNMNDPDPILFGLQSVSVTGTDPLKKYSGAENCRLCPFGYSCSSSSSTSATTAVDVSSCLPGFASAEGEEFCNQCRDQAKDGKIVSYVAPSMRSENCISCSSNMFANLAKDTTSAGIPGRSFCSLQEANYILTNRLYYSDALISTIATHGTTAQTLVRARPEDVQTEISSIPDYPFSSSYNDRNFIYKLDWMREKALVFPASPHRRLEVSLHAGLPDHVSCLSVYEKHGTNLSFGCATNKANGESFSIGNKIEMIPIPIDENNYRTGLRISVSGLKCRSSWGDFSNTFRQTTIEIACDPFAPNIGVDADAEAKNVFQDPSGCSITVYAKWSGACPLCSPKNMGFANTATCMTGGSDHITKSFFFIDAYKRKATKEICLGGLYLPESVQTPCPWIKESIQPSNLEVVAIFLCVITLVTIIIYAIVYLIRNNTKLTQKYQVLRDTYLGSRSENENNNNNSNNNTNNVNNNNNNNTEVVIDHGSTTAVDENDERNDGQELTMTRNNGSRNNSRGSSRMRTGGRSSNNNNGNNTTRRATANSISQINNNSTPISVSSPTSFVARVTSSNNSSNNNNNNNNATVNEDADDVVLNNLENFNTVHEGIYSENNSPRNV